MKCKKCGFQSEHRWKKCPKCSTQVKEKTYAWKWYMIGAILFVYVITLPKSIIVWGDIALHMGPAGFVGFFNSMNAVGYYEYVCEKYPFYVPAQQKLYDIQLAEAQDCDGYRYPYEWAVERLEKIDPYISWPILQAQLDEEIAYYEGLVQQVEDDMYDMVLIDEAREVSGGSALESDVSLADFSTMDGEYFVEWNDKIYFRLYDDDSIKYHTDEFAYGYTGIPMDVCDLMCMDENGNVSFVCKDTGFGPFYIVDVPEVGPMIYGTRINQEQCWELYTCDLNGNNEEALHTMSAGTYYGETEWVAFVERFGPNIIYTNVMDSFYCIETDNGNYQETLGLNTSSVGGDQGTPFAYEADCVYVHDWSNDGFEIRRVTYDGEKEILIHIPEEEMIPPLKFPYDYPPNISRIEFIDQYFCFQLTFRDRETGEHTWNATMVLDMVSETCFYIPSEEYFDYQVVCQDDNLWIYYYDTDVTGKIRTISKCVQVAGSDSAPAGVNPYAEVGAVTLAYDADGNKEIIATPDYSGYSYVVLTDEEVQQVYKSMYCEATEAAEPIQWDLLCAECVGDKLFFSIDFQEENAMQKEEGTNVDFHFYKDMKTGETQLIKDAN